MKLRILVVLLVFMACSKETDIFSGPYITRDGILFSQETNLPITGVALEHYESGELMTQTHYLNGMRHGTTKQFDPNGQLRELANYHSGVLHGSKETFSEYGYLRISENYKMGKLLDQNGDLMTGLVEYKDGRHITKYHYKNGLKDGYGGYFSNSMELMAWCYRKGDLIDDSDPYCGSKKKKFDELLQELKDRKKKGD